MVVDKQEAWNKLPAPLLNRFEKHILEPSHMLHQQFEPVVERLRELVLWLASAGVSSSTATASGTAVVSAAALRAAVSGYREETLPSLVLAVQAELAPIAATAAGTDAAAVSAGASSVTADAMDVDTHSDDSNVLHKQQQQHQQRLFDKCVQTLLWICTPESVLRLQQAVSTTNSSDRGLSELYFKQQAHATLDDALTALTAHYSSSISSSSSSDSTGISVLVATHSALAPGLPHLTGYSAVKHIALHEVSQAADLEQELLFFFNSNSGTQPQLLLLQADVLSTTLRAVEHARYMVDQARTAAAAAAAGATSMRHVCLLLHLPRDSELNSFSLAYSRRWQCAFVDCAAPLQGPSLPDVWSFVSTSTDSTSATAGTTTGDATAMEVDTASVFDTLDKQRVLSLCIRPALSKLRYSSSASAGSSSSSSRSDARTAQHVRAQIQLLLQLLAHNNNSSSSGSSSTQQQSVFTAAMIRAVQHMLSRSDAPEWLSLDKQSLTAGALPDAALRLGGTRCSCAYCSQSLHCSL
jgi:hypothetical protein